MNMNIDWTERAGQLDFDGRAWIDGAFVAAGGEALSTSQPADGAPALRFAAGSQATVNAAVANARTAFDDGRWQRMSPSARRRVMLQWAALIEGQAESLALADTLDVGKPISGALFEAHIAAAFVRYYAEALDKYYSGHTVPSCAQTLEVQVRRPRGVVLAITPWNYPVINACLKLAPALAAGNSAVLKPSPLSPRSAERLAQLALQAGVPPGVFNLVPGGGATGEWLARHGDVDMITFTGSSATGRALMAAAGDSAMKPLMLECGGKNREFVLPDMAGSDLDGLAMQVVMGAMANCGQLCVARSALYVHSSLHDALLARIVGIAGSLRAGLPLQANTQYGAMVSTAQRAVALRYIEQGVADGGRLVVDGRAVSGLPAGGAYLQPSVFSDLPDSSALWRDEIFGPVLCVGRFERIEQIEAIANSGSYGLAATLWTRDLKHANELAPRLRAGKVKVMATPARTEGSMLNQSAEPTRQSGFGVEGGLKGLESYTRQQVVEYSFG